MGKDRGIQKRLFFDVTNSNCTNKVRDQVRKLWADFELGNDNSIVHFDMEEMTNDYPIIADHLMDNGIKSKETVLIHWWW